MRPRLLEATDTTEIYARFRVSVDNGFRNEFSYIDYRKWGVVQLWSAGRITGAPPNRQRAQDRIEVWFNWNLVGSFVSYKEAEATIASLLELSPVNLEDLHSYLKIRDKNG